MANQSYNSAAAKAALKQQGQRLLVVVAIISGVILTTILLTAFTWLLTIAWPLLKIIIPHLVTATAYTAIAAGALVTIIWLFQPTFNLAYRQAKNILGHSQNR